MYVRLVSGLHKSERVKSGKSKLEPQGTVWRICIFVLLSPFNLLWTGECSWNWCSHPTSGRASCGHDTGHTGSRHHSLIRDIPQRPIPSSQSWPGIAWSCLGRHPAMCEGSYATGTHIRHHQAGECCLELEVWALCGMILVTVVIRSTSETLKRPCSNAHCVLLSSLDIHSIFLTCSAN